MTAHPEIAPDRAARGDRRSTSHVLRIVLAIAFVLALGYLLWSAWNHEAVATWKREAGPTRFFAVMAVVPALGVPITPLFLLAGATFGATLGLFGSAAALALNLALCYWVAGTGLRPRIAKLLSRFEYELPDFSAENKGALRFTLFVKMTPGLPAVAKNYLLGLSGVPFATYLWVGMVITGAYGAAIVVVGESLLEHDWRQGLIAGAVLAVLAAVLWLWRREAPRHTVTATGTSEP